ncbi:MAG TPA: DUF4286 family protein [Marinilabiliaceae bacterium]|nr:DUF4286 family protein [Marinilabiliaceae bacterium]
MSYIFNVSFYVNPSFEEKWSAWFKECFSDNTFPADVKQPEVFEVISETPGDFTVFSAQWKCSSTEVLEELDEYMAAFLQQLPRLFGEDITHFSSVLKQIT